MASAKLPLPIYTMEKIMKKITVFLGGTCQDSTWRAEIIKLFGENIDYYNPQKEIGHWSEESKQEEIQKRKDCDILLYTISSASSIVSIAEAVDDSHNRPDRTVVCFLHDTMSEQEVTHITAIGEMLLKNGAEVVTDLQTAADIIDDIASDLTEDEEDEEDEEND